MENTSKKLKKELGLFDLYTISTGAMFSSGFFLLPGLASAQAGPSVILAYLLGGLMVLPAMLSVAELSTAMPKAGGPYYFLDRSLGPMAGTVGGLGTCFALIFKSAFALIGMGAYLAIFIDVNIKIVAVILTLVFMVMNIIGAKKTSRLQGILVMLLVIILVFFVVQGLGEVFSLGLTEVNRTQMTPFMPFGLEGLVSTIGFVFVSYAGLTQVASVAEEVKKPERNIPLGMILSLITATIIYVIGVYIMVALLDPNELSEDLTPVATAANVFFDWLPEPVGLVLIVVAAIAAFASTGNAGILSAARYPFAMARDHLIWHRFATLGRFNTPVVSVVIISGIMIFFILVLDVEAIAKLASAFMLLIFGFLNLAVIVMRESQIESYDPGYRSPLYPWMQIAGMIFSFWLIAEIGLISILFTAGMVLASLIWFYYYAKDKVIRDGAIYHIFERLGRRRYQGLDHEMLGILREKGLRDEDPFDEVVARAFIIDLKENGDPESVLNEATRLISKRLPKSSGDIEEKLPTTPEELQKAFLESSRMGASPVSNGVAIPHLRIHGIQHPEMVLIRSRKGMHPKVWDDWYANHEVKQKVYVIFVLVSPDNNPAQHLRFLSQIAGRVEDPTFLDSWMRAENEQELKEVLLRDERFLSIILRKNSKAETLIGLYIRDLNIPEGSLIAMVRRNHKTIVPRGNTVLQEGDRLTIIGEPKGINELNKHYGTVV
ncbi:MAG: amino acid permease [Balneolales bacterium]